MCADSHLGPDIHGVRTDEVLVPGEEALHVILEKGVRDSGARSHDGHRRDRMLE